MRIVVGAAVSAAAVYVRCTWCFVHFAHLYLIMFRATAVFFRYPPTVHFAAQKCATIYMVGNGRCEWHRFILAMLACNKTFLFCMYISSECGFVGEIVSANMPNSATRCCCHTHTHTNRKLHLWPMHNGNLKRSSFPIPPSLTHTHTHIHIVRSHFEE